MRKGENEGERWRETESEKALEGRRGRERGEEGREKGGMKRGREGERGR